MKNNDIWCILYNNLYRFNYYTYENQYLIYSSLPGSGNYDFVLIDKNLNAGDGKFQGFYISPQIIEHGIPPSGSLLFSLLRGIRDNKEDKILNIYDSLLVYDFINDKINIYKIIFNDNDNVNYNLIQNTSQKGFLYLTYNNNDGYITNPRLAVINNTEIKDFGITGIQYPNNNFSGSIVDIDINNIEDNYENGDVVFNLNDNTLYIKVIIDDGNNNLGLIPTIINNTQIYINATDGYKYSIKTDRNGNVNFHTSKTNYDVLNGYYGETNSENPDYYQILSDVKSRVLFIIIK